MTLQNRINAFVKLGNYLQQGSPELNQKIETSINNNAWFTQNSVSAMIDGILIMLNKTKLEEWLARYEWQEQLPKRIGVIMAGNIPLVGFHDFLSVLLTGNTFVGKLSSQDAHLIPHFADKLIEFDNGFENNISFVERISDIDAIIATGSDNSARYFDYYFSKYPNIIRKNRTSIAILNGQESNENLKQLGNDIFEYHGLGCRNVAKLYVPEGYNFNQFFESIECFSEVGNHNKYRNNYDYNKSIYLVNGVKHLDNGFLLVTENKQLVSPISVLYYETYSSLESLNELLDLNKDKLQCVVSQADVQLENIAFGKSQKPEVWDYADNVDTIKFLLSLN